MIKKWKSNLIGPVWNRKTTGLRLVFINVVIISIITTCTNYTKEKELTQGIIKYDITYLENNLDNISTHLLPKEMQLHFNEDYSLTEIEGFMGLFSIKLISDYRNNTETTIVKFFDNKYVHYGEKNQESSIFQFMEFTDIAPTEDSLKIAGYPARLVTISERDMKDTFHVYYTQSIGCSKPNRNNPYRIIDGVLLRFVLQLSHMRMYLTAQEVINKNIPDSFFDVPEDYNVVSQENMSYLIEEIMSSN